MLYPRNLSGLLLAAFLTGSLLVGCITKDTPATRFYVLSPMETAPGTIGANGSDELSLELVSVRLPPYLERPQLVTRVGGNRLQLLEFEQWGGNLRKNLTRVLARNLSQLLNTADISIAPRRPPMPPDVRIEVEIMQFERMPDQYVHLIAQWRLLGARGHAALATRVTQLKSDAAIDSARFEDTVSAMSNLVGQLSMAMATEIRNLLPR